ncbi:hypothetical protein KM043_007139 [Ampulex compressa]|nr:hypothetical protein KM043_007139 [Ampulex compressa]
MQKSYWGPDMAYVFSIHRMVLWTFGSWPLQGGFIFPLIRWIVITILELSLAVPSLVEFFVFHDSHEAILENLLYVECTILAVAKNIFPRIYINKLAINLRSAADDWSHALDQQEFYHVMRKFARTGRVITLTLFNSAYWAMCIFYLCIVFKPEILIDSSDNVRKGVMKKRKYLASFNWMSDYVGNSTFLAIFICQIIQTLVVGMRQTAVDSFFFNIVIHLCGQLEVLGMRFGNLGRNHGSIAQYQKELGRLVRRHCELMELVENIEDVFNVIILLQILMSVVLIGMTGK